VLRSHGINRAADATYANFADINLTLDDTVSTILEAKHLLARLNSTMPTSVCPFSFEVDENTYLDVADSLQQQARDCWILKPSLLNNGDSIFLLRNARDLIRHYQSTPLMGPHVLQEYIHPPKLLAGKKFTLRMSVVLTNFAGIYIYRHGYLNIAETAYSDDFNSDKGAHLTNYFLDGSIREISQFRTDYLDNFNNYYESIKQIVLQVMQRLLEIAPFYLRRAQHKSIELFGFDFIIDENDSVWLLEVNQGPDFPLLNDHCLMESLWEPYWQDLVKTFVLPIMLKQKVNNSHESQFDLLALHTNRYWQRLKFNLNL